MRTPPTALALAAVLGLSGCASQIPPQFDYTSWGEGALGMLVLHFSHPEARIHVLGESSSPGIDQWAFKISLAAHEDDTARNAILFECGMHAREWFSAETCYMLMAYLLENKDSAIVQELLHRVDVWIIPQSNPAGRRIDDEWGGDPLRFRKVCKGGEDEGRQCGRVRDLPCEKDCDGNGWRTNANLSECPVGVDVARNFSTGWNGAKGCDRFMQFRGDRPFSEPESRNIRRFVHNHMISAAVVIHANGQLMWNLPQTKISPHSNKKLENPLKKPMSPAGRQVVCELAAANLAGVTPDNEARMTIGAFGAGSGQFSAWLSKASDEENELDEGTERNIATYALELPVKRDHYYDGDYDGAPYQWADSDGSNSFHPSSSIMKTVWKESVLPLLLELIRQARSPQCAVDSTGAAVPLGCATNNFSLVGAKIARTENQPGSLSYDATSREETLPGGTYQIVFAVQNQGINSTSTNAQVRIFRDDKPVLTHNFDEITLEAVTLEKSEDGVPGGERGVYFVPYTFSAPHRFRVEINLEPDSFGPDNSKSFAFRTTQVFEVKPWQAFFRELKIRTEGVGQVPSRVIIEGTFVAPSAHFDPSAVSLRVVRHEVGKAELPPEPIVTTVGLLRSEGSGPSAARPPAGASWDGIASGSYRIEPIGRVGPLTRYRLQLVLPGKELAGIRKSPRLILDLRIGEGLRVSGLRTQRTSRLPPPNQRTQDAKDEIHDG